ncbi:ATP-binding protein [Haloferula sargassicola]|uniref:Schlafen AlbA-2 domain-containing protein n=1 Tax=Haloferula sargassicola TaxID=490096 RepID=A0ABP9UIV1_9BACT
MFDTPEELAERIRLPEDSLLELKVVTATNRGITSPHPSSLAQELAAFANSAKGGVLVIGVDDKSREIVGLTQEEAEGAELTIRNLLNDSLEPALSATVSFLELPDSLGTSRLLLRVDVPRSLFVHKAPGGYFERISSSKREMSPQALERLMQQRSQSRLVLFDEQPVPGTTPETLEKKLTDRFVSNSEEPAVDLLRKMGLMCSDMDGNLACSVAGVLIAATRPDQWLHSGACIEAVHYAGTELDSDQQVTSRRIVGPIDRQILEAFEFVCGAMLRPATKEPARVERPSFSERAVFEGIVNAVVHRDYSMAGAKIRLFIFQNRLEIFSPGALPNTLTIETIPHRQYTRNETLVSLLARLTFEIDTPDAPIRRGRFMEARGEGVPIIFREATRLGAPMPVYELFDAQELKLTIFAQARG